MRSWRRSLAHLLLWPRGLQGLHADGARVVRGLPPQRGRGPRRRGERRWVADAAGAGATSRARVACMLRRGGAVGIVGSGSALHARRLVAALPVLRWRERGRSRKTFELHQAGNSAHGRVNTRPCYQLKTSEHEPAQPFQNIALTLAGTRAILDHTAPRALLEAAVRALRVAVGTDGPLPGRHDAVHCLPACLPRVKLTKHQVTLQVPTIVLYYSTVPGKNRWVNDPAKISISPPS